MIKKQLGLLAGSVMLASTASAAITLGSDTIVVFNNGTGGTYIELAPGSTGDTLAGGAGFSIDLTSAVAAIGSVEGFAVFGLNTAETTGLASYNYDEFLYVAAGGGLVYAGSATAGSTNLAAANAIVDIQSYFDVANLGFNADGTAGDADGNGFANSYLQTGTSSIIFDEQQAPTGGINSQLVEFGGTALTAAVVGGNFEVSAVPVPAAAWLFGSALLGLGVVRRKR